MEQKINKNRIDNLNVYVKYILIILILFILYGTLRLFSFESWTNEKRFNYNSNSKKELNIEKMSEMKQHNKYNNENFLAWLSKETMEAKAWAYYKKTFISKDGRVIDPQRASITTSEGQAYAMRRALMMEDKETFDNTYNWAKYNLQHKNDHLFAWLWGLKNPGKQSKTVYGIIDQNGATDAGTEIAINLILASKLWEQENYMDEALNIINDIWDKETIEIKGERILTSGIYQTKAKTVEINPSYFMPYGFKIFAEVDEDHNWQRLVNSSYNLTNFCIDNIKSGLPPDVFYINKKTGVITFDKDKSDFSYDAVRTFYRFYIDYKLTNDSRAEKLLYKSNLFTNRWKNEGKFYTNYKQNGELKDYDQAIGSIAMILPVIKMYNKNIADEIYKNRILSKYHFNGYWEDPLDYYAQNLVWLGNWLYQNEKNIQAFKY